MERNKIGRSCAKLAGFARNLHKFAGTKGGCKSIAFAKFAQNLPNLRELCQICYGPLSLSSEPGRGLVLEVHAGALGDAEGDLGAPGRAAPEAHLQRLTGVPISKWCP